MNILLLGSTGRVGKCVLDIILAKGHDVTVLVRNRSKVTLSNNKLTIVEGDVYQWTLLRQLSKLPFDVIINVVGANTLRPSTLVTDTATGIVALFRERPCVYIAVSGVAQMKKTFFGYLSVAVLKLTPVKYAIEDHQNAFEIIKGSELDWRLIACPHIPDGPASGNYKRSEIFTGGRKVICPGDVALAITNELGSNSSKKVIGVWY